MDRAHSSAALSHVIEPQTCRWLPTSASSYSRFTNKLSANTCAVVSDSIDGTVEVI
jgi:hypothetical protein